MSRKQEQKPEKPQPQLWLYRGSGNRQVSRSTYPKRDWDKRPYVYTGEEDTLYLYHNESGIPPHQKGGKYQGDLREEDLIDQIKFDNLADVLLGLYALDPGWAVTFKDALTLKKLLLRTNDYFWEIDW